MFDYFRNYSSNAHQCCSEDSPTEGRHDHFQTDELDLHSRSQVRLKRDYFFTCNIYLRQYVSYYIHTWHDGRLVDARYYDHARFDDLDLDARSQWIGKGKKSALHAALDN